MTDRSGTGHHDRGRARGLRTVRRRPVTGRQPPSRSSPGVQIDRGGARLRRDAPVALVCCRVLAARAAALLRRPPCASWRSATPSGPSWRSSSRRDSCAFSPSAAMTTWIFGGGASPTVNSAHGTWAVAAATLVSCPSPPNAAHSVSKQPNSAPSNGQPAQTSSRNVDVRDISESACPRGGAARRAGKRDGRRGSRQVAPRRSGLRRA